MLLGHPWGGGTPGIDKLMLGCMKSSKLNNLLFCGTTKDNTREKVRILTHFLPLECNCVNNPKWTWGSIMELYDKVSQFVFYCWLIVHIAAIWTTDKWPAMV